MTVASGQLVYEYSKAFGDEFNWRMPSDYPVIQPSSLLLEEAMYGIRAEYNRVVQQSSGYSGGGRQPRANYNGLFIKWINSAVSGGFDPSPSGGHLAGRLATIGSGPTLIPGTINAGYFVDMKNMFREVVSRISKTSSATPQEIMKHWFQNVKGYSDTYATSGFFFQEYADWSFSDQADLSEEGVTFVHGYNGSSWSSDEYTDSMRQDQVHSGVWLTARHIDELRIQPIPYITSTSGTAIPTNDGAGHNKGFVTTHPVRPRYCRTDGTLPEGYGSTVNIFGDSLVSGMVVLMSGVGSVIQQGSYTPTNEGFSTHLPISGSFTPIAMTSGWYLVAIGMSGTTPGIGLESGLFTWGTTVDNTTPQMAFWPRVAHPPVPDFDNYNTTGGDDLFITSESSTTTGSFGQDGFLVTNKVWANQIWLTKQFSSSNRNVSESGLTWYTPHPILQATDMVPVDFYDGALTSAGPDSSGRMLWGSEYEGKRTETTPVKYLHSNAYSYYRANETIIRAHASGTSVFIPGNGFFEGNVGVLISEWSLPLHTPVFNGITSGNITTGGIVWSHRLSNMTSITHDGSRFVCAGDILRASGTSSTTLATFLAISNKSYWVNDSSYTVINIAFDIATSGDAPSSSSIRTDPMVYHYVHGIGEYLGARQADWGAQGVGGVTSGSYAVITWDFTSPFTAMSGQETRDWQVPTFGSGNVSAGLVAQAVKVNTIRITHFFQDEDDDALFAYFQAEVSGSSSHHRWASRLDTTGGHPYEFRETYDLGIAASTGNQNIALNRSRFSNFMIGFNY